MSRAHRPLALAACAALVASCAGIQVRKGDRAMDLLQLRKAAGHYENALRHRPDRRTSLNLAEALRALNDPARAEALYAQADATLPLEGDTAINYARTLLTLGNADGAASVARRVHDAYPGERVSEDLLTSAQDIARFLADSGRYSVEPIAVPGLSTAFSAHPWGDGLLVVGERPAPPARSDPRDGLSFMDLYTVHRDGDAWAPAIPLPGRVNGRYHEGPAVVDADGRTLYLTRSDYLERKLLKDDANTSHLMIFKATRDSAGNWSGLIDFPYNSPDWSTAHPALSADGRTLYFASDRPGGIGGTDLWMSVDHGGGWTAPVNLGTTVNTPGNELFPTINGGSLYFSSSGHRNMGGLDLFETRPEDGGWSAPRNLHAPLNSPYDDFGLVLDSALGSGYLSSDRSGRDQLYRFRAQEPTFHLEVLVQDDDGRALAGARVTLTSADGGIIAEATTAADGVILLPVAARTKGGVRAARTGHLTRSAEVSTEGLLRDDTLRQVLRLPGARMGDGLVINIHYDKDRWDIRPEAAIELERLVGLINDNPELGFELGAHTDSRGSATYNLLLSEARARSAVDHLVRHGADPARIRAAGHGEERPVNRCADGVECSEEEHGANRRTELRVVRTAAP